jgi:histidine triad (HIT) family protein
MNTPHDVSNTVFSKIIRGEIPAQKLYEDAHVIAILDLNPLAPGHTLVIPKEPAATMGELSDEFAGALGRVLPRICRAVCSVVGAEQCNILQNNGPDAGQSVFHVHIHVIPRFPDRSEQAGLELIWNAGQVDPEAQAELGRKIARKL